MVDVQVDSMFYRITSVEPCSECHPNYLIFYSHKAVSMQPTIFKFLVVFNFWPLFLKNFLHLIGLIKHKENLIQVRYF